MPISTGIQSSTAHDWASKLGDKINDPGFWEKIGNFFMDLWDKIKSLFS